MRKLLLALAGAMLSFYSFADLGEIKVNSYLSQPLNATIPIVGISETNLSELSIGLASSAKFKSSGISFNPELGSLQFKIMNLKSSPYLQITSTRAINSPVLSVLLHYQQNTDDFYRQYTLLLDPIELNDTAVAKVSNNSSRSSMKREIVLNKIVGEKPIAISNNIVKANTIPSNKISLVMNLTNPDVIKQLNQFNPASMIFTTRKDDSLYTVARFEQLIYPNAQFSLNQIIIALGLENYLKLKPLAQVYESGVAIALPLPQDINLIQAKLADQYLLDSTLNPLELKQLLVGVAATFDSSLKIESSELFFVTPIKDNVVKPNIKKPLVVTSIPLIAEDNNAIDVVFEYKYYLILSLLLIAGIVLFRKNIKLFLIRKKILNGEDEASLYSAASIASKKAQKNSNKVDNGNLNSEPYDFLARSEVLTSDVSEIVDDQSDPTASENDSQINHMYIDEELISTLESILAFDESRHDIRYKLFELYLNAKRIEDANLAYFKLEKSLESDSPLRDSLVTTCAQYSFTPGDIVRSVDNIDKLIMENNYPLIEAHIEQNVLIPSVADLSTQEKALLLSEMNLSNVDELEQTIKSPANTNSIEESVAFSTLEASNLVQVNELEDPAINQFSNDRILDFSVMDSNVNITPKQNIVLNADEEFLTYSVKPELNNSQLTNDNNDSSVYHDERLNLAQMYYQIEEFAKSKEILVELLSDAGVSNEVKICAEQLLTELRSNG